MRVKKPGNIRMIRWGDEVGSQRGRGGYINTLRREWEYDERDGRPGATHTFSYDELNRLILRSFADGTTVKYVYDLEGNLATMTDGAGATRYTYDSMNRLATVTTPNGKSVQYTYDAAGHQSSVTYADGKVVSKGYDAAGYLSEVRDWLARLTTYSYTGSGQLASISIATALSRGLLTTMATG